MPSITEANSGLVLGLIALGFVLLGLSFRWR
jgi:hypothetical protein